MFDAEYFNTHIYGQIEQLGAGSTTTEVHVRDGAVYHVRKLGEAHSGYVELEVYPPEGASSESRERRKKPGGIEEVFYDRLALPYEQITKVLHTIGVPDGETPRKILQTTSINIWTMENSALQVNSPAASQSVVATIHNTRAVDAVLTELRSVVDQIEFDERIRHNLLVDVETAMTQLKKQPPNQSVLRVCLSSIKATLENVVATAAVRGGSAIVNALIAKISTVLGG